MTITSKFNGKCKKCGGFIKAGQEIEWDKENGPRHITCPAQKSFTPAPKPSQQLRQVGGPKNQQPFKPGSMPYRGKFRPRTTTTFNDKSATRTL